MTHLPSRLLILILALAAPTACAEAGRPVEPFKPADYPASRYEVTEAVHPFGDVEIRIVHAKPTASDAEVLCKAWLEIRPKSGGSPKRVFGQEIEPVGDSYGLFVPREQPSPDYFLVVKQGDYDGRLFLIDKKGTTRDLPGGSFLLDRSRQLLFSEYASDVPDSGLVVLDLPSGQVVHKSGELSIESWYRNGSELFFTQSGRDGTIFLYDPARRQVASRPASPEFLEQSSPVDPDFDPRKHKDCYSEPAAGR